MLENKGGKDCLRKCTASSLPMPLAICDTFNAFVGHTLLRRPGSHALCCPSSPLRTRQLSARTARRDAGSFYNLEVLLRPGHSYPKLDVRCATGLVGSSLP